MIFWGATPSQQRTVAPSEPNNLIYSEAGTAQAAQMLVFLWGILNMFCYYPAKTKKIYLVIASHIVHYTHILTQIVLFQGPHHSRVQLAMSPTSENWSGTTERPDLY